MRFRGDAETLLKNARYAGAWLNAGYAMECLLKAAYMKQTRLNRFPTRTEDPRLHTHDLEALFRRLGIALPGLHMSPVAPKLRVVLEWSRNYGYNPDSIPGVYATDMCRAAFGDDGVAEWIMNRYRLT